ncbi:aquaporin 1a (Colton blood group), tandem duplicate 2 [Silurus asotus]|uniref:Aquaporin 1a (Colton blood group), tandem duplicate 2 n=1 Tax=Silurus asotus TaxID=30991 RepID=A0AAD5FJK7_SILAS|nr:aquaporin 1a (Colton blood group), tandem duplicate 2 [Silurus asotus]
MMKELQTLGFWRAVLAELIGTTMFVFCGVSAAIGNGNSSYPDQEVKVALAFGLAIVVLCQSFWPISGGHLNPAVTLALLVSCQISLCRALWYIVAQVTGAVIASGIVLGVRPSVVDSLGLNKLNGVSPGQGFGIEFLLTLQMVLCYLATMDKRRNMAGLAPFAFGLSVVLGHLAGISYTGCGINPARSFGPALVSVEFEHHWVYWAGPMCGGIVAALLYDFILFPRGADVVGRLKVLCHGAEASAEATEPLLEGNAPAAQWEKP